MILLLFLFSCVYATTFPYTNGNNRDGDLSIINGNNARRYQFPYIVSVQLQGVHWCGASIISESWLVSASHCYNSSLTYRAVAGLLVQDEMHNDVQNISIETIVYHPDYESSAGYLNEIALLKLKNPLRFSRSVMPVSLPEPRRIPSGQAMTSGWGQITKNPTEIQAFVLQYLEVKLLTNKECSKYVDENPFPVDPHLNDTITMTNHKLCGFPKQRFQSICHYDSGGPLVQENVLVGVTHAMFDVTCNQAVSIPYPHIYISVSHFTDFIKEYVEL